MLCQDTFVLLNKEGKIALHWTRLSWHAFLDNAVRLQLFAFAYFKRASRSENLRLTTPPGIPGSEDRRRFRGLRAS